jgi:aminoglycoside phosphotransferase (APT) family kinase protein
MNLDELSQRLQTFCRAKYDDDAATVCDVIRMPGHAGFAFGFTVHSRGITEKWFLRLPPPNVQRTGTADVMRQVAVLNVLPDAIPHCRVKWSGTDEQWFACPYFIVPQLEGDVLRTEPGSWITALCENAREAMALQAIDALARLHKIDWQLVPYLGGPVHCRDDVLRWDRFIEKVAEPHLFRSIPQLKSLLLQKLPERVAVGIFHGDFHWANLFYAADGKLLAVIDWELVGIGAVLNDLGWLATFNDPAAWAADRRSFSLMPGADALIALYQQASGQSLPDLEWFRALACYKFAIISGFNLMLHRRGKRHDSMWEISKESIQPLLGRALQLLSD